MTKLQEPQNPENEGQSKLKAQLDTVLSNIADDLKKINQGEIDDLRILGLDDKLYKRINELLKLPAEFAAKMSVKPISEASTTQDSKSETKGIIATTFKLGDNPFEVAITKAKEKKNGHAKL